MTVKAFGTIYQDALIFRLHKFGVPVRLLQLIYTYLSHRTSTATIYPPPDIPLPPGSCRVQPWDPYYSPYTSTTYLNLLTIEFSTPSTPTTPP